MTNTRITDPEILERRFPVLLRKFHHRENSRGTGKYLGGNGVIRQLEFRRPLTVSILSERRAFRPYGLAGGGAGERGLNLLRMREGEEGGREEKEREARVVNLGGKSTVQVCAGWVLTVYTPGGGGYGVCEEGPGPERDNGLQQARGVEGKQPTFTQGGSLHQYRLQQESA